MLSTRQHEIVRILQKNSPSALAQLEDSFHVGERTIRNDIREINSSCRAQGFELIIRKQNVFLEIQNPEVYKKYLSIPISRPKYSFSIPESRVDYILTRLLCAHDYVTGQLLEDEMFISTSSLTQDLTKVRRILNEYELTLETRPHHGMFLTGKEINKRKLIIARGIQFENEVDYLFECNGIDTEPISRILTEALLKWEFRISDIVFQNLVMHLSTSIIRLRSGFYLESSGELPTIYKHAQNISSEILREISSAYNVPFEQEEVKQLAINLQGKREYDISDCISKETNDFVFDALCSIKSKFGVDFLADLNFRMDLALHTKPLITRLQAKIQLDNNMTFDIKQKYSYAFDLASEYSYRLTQKYDVRLNDDEIAYLAIHFIVGLRKIEQSKASKRILLICEQRKRNTVLIQQQILQWFSEEIQSIELAGMVELTQFNLNEYDAILTTNDSALEKIPQAVRINFFPTQADHVKIEMALSGITNSQDILRQFIPELFLTGTFQGKNDVIQQLSDKAEMLFPNEGKLLESVMTHEKIANTYFGNGIAMPHPDTPVSSQSFICTAIPDKPILWDYNQPVKLVLLVSIEKDNPSALQIWQYLSYLIADEELIQEILKNHTYSNFVQVITKFYKNLLGH